MDIQTSSILSNNPSMLLSNVYLNVCYPPSTHRGHEVNCKALHIANINMFASKTFVCNLLYTCRGHGQRSWPYEETAVIQSILSFQLYAPVCTVLYLLEPLKGHRFRGKVHHTGDMRPIPRNLFLCPFHDNV